MVKSCNKTRAVESKSKAIWKNAPIAGGDILFAVYISLNQGELPPKHNLPCFKKDDIFNLIGSTSERMSRATKWIAEQVAKYGK